MQTETTENIKYAYIQDPMDPRRVITIAREINNGVIRYGMAINRVSKRAWAPQDRFNKELGRRIASGRLHKNPCEVQLTEGVPAIVTVLEDLQDRISYAFSIKEMTFLRRAVYAKLCSMERQWRAKQAEISSATTA